METARFTLQANNDAANAANITRLLGSVPGVGLVRVPLAQNQASVQYDATIVRPEHLQQVLAEAGIIAEPAGACCGGCCG